MIRILVATLITALGVQTKAQSRPAQLSSIDLGVKHRHWDEKVIDNDGARKWSITAVSRSQGPQGLIDQALEVWINGKLFYTQVQPVQSEPNGAVAEKYFDLPRKPGAYHIRIKCGSIERDQDMCHLYEFEYPDKVPPRPAPPEAPATKPDAKNEFWMLLEPMQYVIGNTDAVITVPAGFVHDFASIPQALHSFGLSPHGLYSRAAIIHDWLYWSQSCSPEQANRIMVLAMKESGVSRALAMSMYAVLDIAGGKAWKQNTSERKNQYPRIIPENLRKLPANMTWPIYRDTLFVNGIRDPVVPEATYCAYGDSFDVPGGIVLQPAAEPKIQPLPAKATLLNP